MRRIIESVRRRGPRSPGCEDRSDRASIRVRSHGGGAVRAAQSVWRPSAEAMRITPTLGSTALDRICMSSMCSGLPLACEAQGRCLRTTRGVPSRLVGASSGFWGMSKAGRGASRPGRPRSPRRVRAGTLRYQRPLPGPESTDGRLLAAYRRAQRLGLDCVEDAVRQDEVVERLATVEVVGRPVRSQVPQYREADIADGRDAVTR